MLTPQERSTAACEGVVPVYLDAIFRTGHRVWVFRSTMRDEAPRRDRSLNTGNDIF